MSNVPNCRRWTINDYGKGFTNVLLHVNLHAACRPSTLLEICKRRNINLFESENVFGNTSKQLLNNMTDLLALTENWKPIATAFADDKEAIERLASEFVEDCASQRIAYVEVNFSPFLLIGDSLQPFDVMEIILNTFRTRGEAFGVNCRAILSIFREAPQDAMKILDLARRFQERGVVGISLTGDERQFLEHGVTDSNIVQAFCQAKFLGINRVVEAGEIKTTLTIKEALYELHAERIGHGYAFANDEELASELRNHGIHLTFCPTWAVRSKATHPCWFHSIILLALSRKMSFSINTGVPLFTGLNLIEEYKLCLNKLDMTDADLGGCNINAAENSFLHFTEQRELIEHLLQTNPLRKFTFCYCRRLHCTACSTLRKNKLMLRSMNQSL